MESQNIEFIAVIKFLTKEGAKAKEIHRRMADVYGDSNPKYSTVAKWSAEFNHGRDSLEDDPRPGRPADVISQEMMDRVERLVLNNCWIKVAELASECGISIGSVYTIIHEHLGMSKVSARWVPRNLTMQDGQQSVESSQELLEVYNANPEDFHTRLVTGDETWLHHWDPDTKKESMQWKRPGSPPPKKFRTQPSASKVMATVFWDSKGIILIDYKPSGTSITGEYYANVIKQLRVAIKEKRRGKLAAGVLLLHDNAPVHKSRVAQAAVRECKFEQLKSPTIQSRPGPKWLLSVSKFEVPLPWNEISGWWWAQGCYRGLVWGPNRWLLFQRHRLLKRKVGQMHRSKGGLYWKIMLKPSSNLWVKPRVLRTYWTPLVYV